ncbi:MAG: hypothetical protein KDA41_07170, partial [Planctomycetales bacterium]|nr:hypothetical protein [Planctomycetales bacterium]
MVFYPTFGHRVARGWDVHIHAAVFREGVEDFRKRIFMGLLRRVLRASHEDLLTDIFRDRIEGFLLREQPGRRVAIQLADRAMLLPKRTRRDGHLRVKLHLSDHDIEHLTQQGSVELDWLNIHAVTANDDPRRFVGAAQLMSPTGVSVISDIDDTLKHTAVGQRGALLSNTFFREFQAIAGMPKILRQ